MNNIFVKNDNNSKKLKIGKENRLHLTKGNKPKVESDSNDKSKFGEFYKRIKLTI